MKVYRSFPHFYWLVRRKKKEKNTEVYSREEITLIEKPTSHWGFSQIIFFFYVKIDVKKVLIG